MVFLLLSATAILQGQTATGTLSGKVTSAQGNAVPNAAVTITNQQTNVSQRVLTGPDGSFTVAGLAPGAYRVEVESAGFKRAATTPMQLTVGAPASINITLEPGPSTETVELTAVAPMATIDSGVTVLALPTRPVRSYPIVDRNYQELNGLMTGVTPPLPLFSAAVDPAQNRFYSVNGQNPFVNRRHLDGSVNLEPFRGGAIRVQPVETVQELQIRTGTLRPENGFTAAGWTNVVTRPATNGWHGSLFEFNTNDQFNARNTFSPYNNRDGANTTNLVYNQFGGTVGKAIVPDKSFLFLSYEGTYDRDHRASLSTVPTLAMRQGNFSGIPGTTIINPSTGVPFTNNVIPSGQINPFTSSIANALPAPNLPGLFNNYGAISYLRRDGNKLDGRFDQHFSDRTTAFLRYGYSNWGVVDESPLGFVLGPGSTTRLVGQNAMAGVVHNFTTSMLTELRLGYNRYRQRITPRDFSSPFSAGINAGTLPIINIAGMNTLGSSFLPGASSDGAVDNTYHITNNWSFITGHHTLQAGAEVNRFMSDGFNNLAFAPAGAALFGPETTLAAGTAPGTAGGVFPNAFASFLLGAPQQLGSTSFLATPAVRQWQMAGYVGDRFSLARWRKVTFDVGVRYNVFSPLEPRHTGGAMFYNPANNTLSLSNIGGAPNSIQDWNLRNWAPRFGVAIGLTTKTVIRAGYMISYFQVPYQSSYFMPSQFGAVLGTAGVATPVAGRFGPGSFTPLAPPASFANGMSAGNIPVVFASRHVPTPYVQSYNFQIQHELPTNLLLQVGYVGTLGRELPFLNDLNVGTLGAGAAGQPFFGAFGRTAPTYLYSSGLTNNYNSLQTTLTKRLSHGLQFQAAYTWSKALDYGSNFGTLLNPFNRAANYGLSDYDRQHVLSIAHLFAIPVGKGSNIMPGGIIGEILGGWELNGIFRWSTGSPFTVLATPVGCNCPGLPFVNASATTNHVKVSDSVGPFANLINPGLFTQPVGGFGNLGRNSFRGPGFKNYDLSLFKDFVVRDNYRLEIRGSAFNLTNTPRFSNPMNLINSPAFGQTVEPLSHVDGLNAMGGRIVQLGARLLF